MGLSGIGKRQRENIRRIRKFEFEKLIEVKLFSALSRREQKLINESLHKAVAGFHDPTLGWTEGGDLDEIEQLIEQGANLNYLDENGNNAYHEACNKGQLDSKFIYSLRKIITYLSHRTTARLFPRGVEPAKQIQPNSCQHQ